MNPALKAQMELITNLMAVNGGMTLKELSTESGINHTRCFRLKNGIGELVLSEIQALEGVFKIDLYNALKNRSTLKSTFKIGEVA